MFLQVYEFDPAEYLTDEAAVVAYLEKAKAEGDSAGVEDAERVAARARLRLAQNTPV